MQEMDQTGHEPQVLANHDFSNTKNQHIDNGVNGGCVPDKTLKVVILSQAQYKRYIVRVKVHRTMSYADASASSCS